MVLQITTIEPGTQRVMEWNARKGGRQPRFWTLKFTWLRYGMAPLVLGVR